jgi:hypothetical protein
MNHAQQPPDRELLPKLEPWVKLLPGPTIHADFASLAALPTPDEHGAAGSVEVAFLESERFADPQAGAPEQHDQRAKPPAVGTVADTSYHRDDLLDRRRVGRVLLALVAWRAAPVIARHRRRRATVTGDIRQHGFHESSLGGNRLTMRCYSNSAAAPLEELRATAPRLPVRALRVFADQPRDAFSETKRVSLPNRRGHSVGEQLVALAKPPGGRSRRIPSLRSRRQDAWRRAMRG